MAYEGEYASGDSLWRLVSSQSVKEFQGIIRYGDGSAPVDPPAQLSPHRGAKSVNRLIVIDGSTVTKDVLNGFPGAQAALLQLAAVVIDIEALRGLSADKIPRPSQIRDIEQCATLDAVLPGRNVVRRDIVDDTPERYFRFTIQEMLAGSKVDADHETLLETLRAISPSSEGFRCPIEDCEEVIPHLEGAGVCPCVRREPVFETDSLRLYERFEDYGSSEQAYTAARMVVEQLALVNILRYFNRKGWWNMLNSTAFVLDGPLAVFGMPAKLKGHFEAEVRAIHEAAVSQGGPGVLLFGVEKTGHFMDHLRTLDHSNTDGPRSRLDPGSAMAPDRKYTHRHIVLRPIEAKAHGDVTDWGRRVMYKNKVGQHSVVMTPIVNDQGRDRDCVDEEVYPRLGEVLDIMDELSTYLYEDGFAPLVRAHAHAAIPLSAGTGLLAQLFQDQ